MCREGLFVALLAAAQRPRDLAVVAAAGQVHAAQPLDRNDLSLLERRAGQLDPVALDTLSGGVQVVHLWAADRTAVRLGVIAAVFDVVILPVAVRAHREGAHRGLGPVVGHVLDDREARAAVRAVDEGVAVTAVLRVPQLPQAVLADADVRGDQRVALRLGFAREDLKIPEALEFGREIVFHPLDDGELRGLFGQVGDKTLELCSLALKLQLDAGGGVLDRAAQRVVQHKLMNKGAEAHALDDAVYVYQDPFQDRASPEK